MVELITAENINRETNRRKLLSLAYGGEALAKSGKMPPDEYTECMLSLVQKLGFGITPENLQKAVEDLATDDAARARDSEERNV